MLDEYRIERIEFGLAIDVNDHRSLQRVIICAILSVSF